MGTINVFGLARPKGTNYRPTSKYTARTKLEMAWAVLHAKEYGYEIIEWYALTKQGQRMIGAVDNLSPVPSDKLRLPQLVKCPICQGKKIIDRESPKSFPKFVYCPVCDGTGFTRKGYWKNWENWQLENMAKEFGNVLNLF